MLRDLGFVVPTYSALAKIVARIPLVIWQKLLVATTNIQVNVAAMDSSGFSRNLPSVYYIKRIDKPYPLEVPIKASILVDTRRKKILSLRIRAKKSSDIKDARYLLKRTK